MEQIIQVFLNCLVLSANYILLAVGLTLIFGILTTLNFSHGVLYIVGAYFIYTFINILGVHYVLASVITVILVAGIGLVFEGLIFYPLKDQHFLSPIGAIMGVGMIIEGTLAFIYMGDDVSIGSFFKGVVPIAGAKVSLERVIVVGVCALVMLGVYIWIRKTKQGSAIRCLAENAKVANMQGINTRFIRYLVMGIACGLAAFAATIIAPLYYINPYMGGHLVIKALLVVAVGGMGSVEGSILAGILIGFIETIGVTFIGDIAEVVSFIAVIVVFLFRPQGLLGVKYEFH